MPQNVTRQRPCPICGKPDMCFSNIRQDGVKVSVCGRIRQEIANGYDGRTYKMLPQKKTSNYAIYVDYEEDLVRSEERRRQWCMDHGYPYKPKEGVILPPGLSPVDEVWEYDRDIIQPLSHEELNAILRPWMEKDLILSDFHRKKLMAEWGKNPRAAEEIFSTWPIRSLTAVSPDQNAFFLFRFSIPIEIPGIPPKVKHAVHSIQIALHIRIIQAGREVYQYVIF